MGVGWGCGRGSVKHFNWKKPCQFLGQSCLSIYICITIIDRLFCPKKWHGFFQLKCYNYYGLTVQWVAFLTFYVLNFWLFWSVSFVWMRKFQIFFPKCFLLTPNLEVLIISLFQLLSIHACMIALYSQW